MPTVKTDRETIIVKSIHQFKVYGYYHTSMTNIGEVTGLRKGSIYHHFESKEALALACLQYIHNHFKEHIYAVADNRNFSDVEKLRFFLNKTECYFLNSEGGCLLGNFALELSNNIPELKAEIISYFYNWEQALYRILLTQLGEQFARTKAKEIVANTQGNIMMMRLFETPEIFIKSNKEVFNLLS